MAAAAPAAPAAPPGLIDIVTFDSGGGTARDAGNTPPRPRRLSWAHLAASLASRHVAVAPGEPPGGPPQELWAPLRFAGGGDAGAGPVAVEVTCFVAEFGGDGTQYTALLPRWEGLAWALHTTRESTAGALRFRVAFPLARPVPAGLWPAVRRRLALALLGEHALAADLDRRRGGNADDLLGRRYPLTPSCPAEAWPHAMADHSGRRIDGGLAAHPVDPPGGRALDPDDLDAFPEPEPEDEAEAGLRDFLSGRCVLRPSLKVTAAALYGAYLAWCDEREGGTAPALGRNTFGRRLRLLGLPGVRTATGIGRASARGWAGVGLRERERERERE